MTNNPTIDGVSRELTAERLRALFEYDQETGNFIRRFDAISGGSRAGDVAGGLNDEGRVLVRVDGGRYLAHRLAWLYMTGEWPKDMIDHKDMNRSNNAWNNLRECDNGQNKMNASVQANNQLGVKNVHRIKNGSYKVSIAKDKKYHQKIFKTLEAAAEWANAKRQELHGEFTRA